MTTALRPMTLGELLDRTFFLYRGHFLVFAGIVALPQLIVLALQLATLAFPPRLFLGMLLLVLQPAVAAVGCAGKPEPVGEGL